MKPAVNPTGAAKFGASVAAFAGALMWAVLVNLTQSEVGWFAWGIGGLVGFVMSRMTTERSRALAWHAAMVAALGLASGKVMSLLLAAPDIADQIVENEDMLTRAFILDMRGREQYTHEVNLELAKFDPARDTLPDALWEKMLEEATVRMEAAPPAERQRVAQAVWRQITNQWSFGQKFFATLGFMDFFWFVLAIGTAWQMMKPAD
ncbi:MAG TPA: hypothetical protein VGA20_02440 [Gemmatimonadales bacterium]